MNNTTPAGYPAEHHVEAATTLLVCIAIACLLVAVTILFG